MRVASVFGSYQAAAARSAGFPLDGKDRSRPAWEITRPTEPHARRRAPLLVAVVIGFLRSRTGGWHRAGGASCHWEASTALTIALLCAAAISYR